jgi:hypothetical protein
LKTEVELGAADPVVPRLDFDQADRKAVLELTRRLIENEKQDAAALKRLRKELDDAADTTLWALIIDSMLLDTQKHLTMLRFVERNVRARRR